MQTIGGLSIESEGTGITRPLSENVNLLGGLLGHAIREQAGGAMLDLVEELRLLCKRALLEDDPGPRREAATRISALSDADIGWLLRAFSAFFHLVNQAERQEILRINRERSHAIRDGRPRPESIDDAVAKLKADGFARDAVLDVIRRLDIQPTFTAHPTEARRRSILDKQRRIADLLSEPGKPDATPEDRDAVVAALRVEIALLVATDEVRAERPSVRDEVEQGLHFLRSTVWSTAPRIHDDVEHALERHYGVDAVEDVGPESHAATERGKESSGFPGASASDVPVFLRWRSWIGGDQDGNPNVTPDVIRWTLDRHRCTALELHRDELYELGRELSLSDRTAPTPDRLIRALGETPDSGFRHEPYRRFVIRMRTRIDALLAGRVETPMPADYTADQYIADLDLLATSLDEAGFGDVARHGRLNRLRVLARTFGFHLAALDVRQHSRLHTEAITAILAAAGVTDDYAALDEDARIAALARELCSPRPLLPRDAELPEPVNRVLETFAVIRDAITREASAIGSYIVSMTHAPGDVLAPLLLAKEVGLWRTRDGRVESPLDMVPLFETIDDLDAAAERLTALFALPVYRLHLEARGGFQEIMLGYSDSNKDGGYWMASWALHRAQGTIARVCHDHGIAFRLFHGRGGTVGRGGGRANLAIAAMPAAAHNGRLRVTEQGEVITFRYALPGIAHRHAEQLVSAILLTTARAERQPRSTSTPGSALHSAVAAAAMDAIAERAMRAYRALVDDEAFWRWYIGATPIEQISRLPIASRPVSRKGAGEVDFDGLRAIPWVFAWTQTRHIVPGWFGTGAALDRALADAATADMLRGAYETWPFFRDVIHNAELEMARARLDIAAYYAALAGDDGSAGGIHARIARDFDRARAAILRITGETDLLDRNPVIRKSILLRNPYTDVLNLLQVELLRRNREASAEQQPLLRELLFHSINGIAAAMQSTG
ncbi:MAG: phosphoenolpyruvate carboxylase [Longimicrobiales bacterium]